MTTIDGNTPVPFRTTSVIIRTHTIEEHGAAIPCEKSFASANEMLINSLSLAVKGLGAGKQHCCEMVGTGSDVGD